MNKILDFAKENRTTTYFRDMSIREIKLSYRIMEYLAPDDIFPPSNLDKITQTLLNNKHFDEAIERIIAETKCDSSSSLGAENLRENMLETIEFLYKERYEKLERDKKAIIEKLEIELKQLKGGNINVYN